MKKGLKIILSIILFLIGLIPFPYAYINFIFLFLSYLVVGGEVLLEAGQNLFKRQIFDETFLMSLATIGAFLIGCYEEAVVVMLLYQVGEFFQDYAVDKSKKSIQSLMALKPDIAQVIRDGKTIKVDPKEVKVGEKILVGIGEKVPLDGVVVKGSSYLDTKALTGESVLKTVKAKEAILSGCINMESPLEVEVTAPFETSTVSKILALVENASSKKTRSENFITRFSKVYTPIVVFIALLLAFVPPLLFNGSWHTYLYRALSFLVVSCPCALVISIPLSFFAGMGASSQIGVLVKGSNYLERLSKTKIMAFDKTGTLTEGVFEVVEVNPIGIPKEELLYYSAACEYYSHHPIASSIKTYYKKKIDSNDIKNVKEKAGYGVEAFIDDKKVLVGNEKFMKKEGISFEKSNAVGTIVYVAIDGVYSGNIVIADKIKPRLKSFVPNLQKEGIEKTVLLTGDKLLPSKKVTETLKIDECYSELLPQDKVQIIENLKNELENDTYLAFVGDGLNDAAVLAMSDIGISMGGLGSDAAIDQSDIVILEDDPTKIVPCLKISKKTMGIVHFNIIFVLFVKALILLLSALGVTHLWISIFGDVGVTILASLNALRILNVKKFRS